MIMLAIGERFYIETSPPKMAKLMVQKIGEDGVSETYHIIGRDRIAILKSNRPLKENGAERRIKWKLVQPVIADQAAIEDIGKKIEWYWKQRENSEKPAFIHPKNFPETTI